jgi:signal transduction histidine kinase
VFVNQVSTFDETAIHIPSPPIADTRLSGTRLIIARGLWIALMLLFCGFYLAAVLVYYVRLHGFQEGVYAHLISTPAVVSGYDAFESSYLPFTGPYATLNITLITLFSLIWIAVSLLIFWRRSDDWMALYISLFLVMLVTNLSPALSVLSRVVGFTSPLGVCITLLHLLCVSSAVFFFALFPDGRFVPGWTRWLILVWLAWQVPFCLPSTSPFSLMRWPLFLLASTLLCLVLTCGFAQLYRYRHVSTAIQRQQTKWIVFGMLVGTLFDVANLLPPLIWPALAQPGPAHALYTLLSEVTFPLVFLLVPVTIGVAVLRYRLWDIDLLLNRTLVYGLLTASIIGLYLLVVVGLGTLFSALGNLLLSLLATGLVAVLFQPLRERLQRVVNRLMFGERDDPYRILLRLGSRLEETLSTDSVLPTIVETVAQALKLPYAAITWGQEASESSPVVAASYGTMGERQALVRVPLVYRQEQVGELWLAPRSPDEDLTPADRLLLHDLARQVGVAVHAVRLTADLQRLTHDLQRSRERLVASREEERRRLRRDLHDGLGPRLAGLTLKLETARNRLAHDPLAETLLSDLIARTQEAVADIRRLVYALRPPALDELGLIPALQEQVLQYSDPGHHEIHISLEAPEHLPPLPAAVEVAIFRIAQEALTNVVRHSRASRCVVRLGLHEQERLLELEIEDNGRGIDPARSAGVGLASMRERAEELGGTCEVKQVLTGGTCVHVRLPSLLPQLSETETPDRESEMSLQGEGAS